MSAIALPISRPAAGGLRGAVLEIEGPADLDAGDAAALRAALQAVGSGHPAIRGASLYRIARGQAVVRLVTARGWVPVMLSAADLCDAAALVSHLEAALAPA